MKRATTGSGSSLSTGVSLSTFPWKVWGEADLRVAPHPCQEPTLSPDGGRRADSLSAHHFFIAVGVHRPRLAVVAEAHEEGCHKVVTGEQMAVRARLPSLPQVPGTQEPKPLLPDLRT